MFGLTGRKVLETGETCDGVAAEEGVGVGCFYMGEYEGRQ